MPTIVDLKHKIANCKNFALRKKLRIRRYVIAKNVTARYDNLHLLPTISNRIKRGHGWCSMVRGRGCQLVMPASFYYIVKLTLAPVVIVVVVVAYTNMNYGWQQNEMARMRKAKGIRHERADKPVNGLRVANLLVHCWFLRAFAIILPATKPTLVALDGISRKLVWRYFQFAFCKFTFNYVKSTLIQCCTTFQ